MESGTQTTIFNYLTLPDLPTHVETQVGNGSDPYKEDSQQFVYLIQPDIVKEDYSDDDDDDDEKSKGRTRNPENWRQNIRKRNKNQGLAYVKVNGAVSARKELGPPCACKMKCFKRIGEEACKKIFANFWKLGDHSLQNAYIGGCVRILLPKHYTKNSDAGQPPSRRYFTRNFYVNVNGVDTEICKQAFLNVHNISNGRLDRLLKKKQEIGNTGVDARGRHHNKVNKIPVKKIREVRRSIDEFRKRAGFTGKRKPKNVEMLPATLNIRTMYRKYREEVADRGLEPVCEFRYRKIFHSDFHIDFCKTTAAPTATTATTTSCISRQPVQPKLDVPLSSASSTKVPTLQMTSSTVVQSDHSPRSERPIYTTLETKDLSTTPTYVQLPQDLYNGYSVQTQGWIFPTQTTMTS